MRWILLIFLFVLCLCVLGCTNGKLCNQEHPCRKGDSCVSGVCQRGTSQSRPPTRRQPSGSSSISCTSGKQRSAWDYECSETQECACLYGSSPACTQVSTIKLDKCYRFTDSVTKTKHGFCTVSCSIPSKNCMCPKMFGRPMNCNGYFGDNVSEGRPLCWPGGTDRAKAWPHQCKVDADCIGKLASR